MEKSHEESPKGIVMFTGTRGENIVQSDWTIEDAREMRRSKTSGGSVISQEKNQSASWRLWSPEPSSNGGLKGHERKPAEVQGSGKRGENPGEEKPRRAPALTKSKQLCESTNSWVAESLEDSRFFAGFSRMGFCGRFPEAGALYPEEVAERVSGWPETRQCQEGKRVSRDIPAAQEGKRSEGGNPKDGSSMKQGWQVLEEGNRWEVIKPGSGTYRGRHPRGKWASGTGRRQRERNPMRGTSFGLVGLCAELWSRAELHERMRRDITVSTGLFPESLKVQPQGEVQRGSGEPMRHYGTGSILWRRSNCRRVKLIRSDAGK